MSAYDDALKEWCAKSLKVDINEIVKAKEHASTWIACDTCGPESELEIWVYFKDGREAELNLRYGNIADVLRGDPIYEGWEITR